MKQPEHTLPWKIDEYNDIVDNKESTLITSYESFLGDKDSIRIKFVIFSFGIKENIVMFFGEKSFARPAPFLNVDKMINEILFSKNSIQKQFHFIHRVLVGLHEKNPVALQKVVAGFYPEEI